MIVNDIISAISIALNAEFNPEVEEARYEVTAEEIKQGLQEPCFFIKCINRAHEQFLSRRYHQGSQFVIQYFPESSTGYEAECNDVADRLTWCLEYITCVGDTRPIRGTGMHAEVNDGVLSFFVNYDGFVLKPYSEVVMETLESAVGTE
ncbi:hypothetical protein BXO88_09835 [Oribacterium sp. C9]|uniref:phage tail terminator family protein n=1 Tax=Oribacterium sp. C9 TaxID=1943579 RepID=UPI0009C9CEEA|nr:hypothetical protein [Oribacterium sp. C9]OON85919.1 hypothetical protein BXO88_09835 [Oribacterium sp. C9]